jgi:hypothetical protein
MTKKHFGHAPRSRTPFNGVHLPVDTPFQLHLEKVGARNTFQPFDMWRHHNHMSWLPNPHIAYRVAHTPDNNGFWGKHGMDG